MVLFLVYALAILFFLWAVVVSDADLNRRVVAWLYDFMLKMQRMSDEAKKRIEDAQKDLDE